MVNRPYVIYSKEPLMKTTDNKIKLGLDVHGVIDHDPVFFSKLSRMVMDNGGEVHIITGGSWTLEFEEEVRSKGVVWTHHFSVYDHLIGQETLTVGEVSFPDGKTQKKFVNGVWDPIKGEYCREHNISIHFDDTLVYRDYFTTPFIHYKK